MGTELRAAILARQDQFCFDFTGLRDRVMRYRRDRLWAKISLSEKVRILIAQGLEAADSEADSEAIALIRKFVLAVAEQRSLDGFSITEIADALDLEPELIERFWRCGNGSKTH